MILIIDGYNLLKQIFPGAKQNLDKQKSVFIKQLAYYKSKKSHELSDIVVVFDAGLSNHATREIKSGIVVVYSGVKSSADNWILHFVERNKGKELLVVTLDRELRKACQTLNADTIDVHDFYKILQQNLLEQAEQAFVQPGQTLEKYDSIPIDEQAPAIDNIALDLLMEQASFQTPEKFKNDVTKEIISRKGKSLVLSKKDRRMLKKIKKLQ